MRRRVEIIGSERQAIDLFSYAGDLVLVAIFAFPVIYYM
jgi:hypothetical protein